MLDIGIYSLTWGLTTLTDKVGDAAEDPEVDSQQTIEYDVDTSSSFLLKYPSNGRQAVLSSSTNYPGHYDSIRIEGSKGYIIVHGAAPSNPESFTFHPKGGGKEEHYTFEKPGRGFYW